MFPLLSFQAIRRLAESRGKIPSPYCHSEGFVAGGESKKILFPLLSFRASASESRNPFLLPQTKPLISNPKGFLHASLLTSGLSRNDNKNIPFHASQAVIPSEERSDESRNPFTPSNTTSLLLVISDTNRQRKGFLHALRLVGMTINHTISLSFQTICRLVESRGKNPSPLLSFRARSEATSRGIPWGSVTSNQELAIT